MGNAVLAIQDLTYSWPGQREPLFGSITSSFEGGLITTVLGSNGSGKTTFLNVLARRLPQSAGSLQLDGRSPTVRDFNYMLQEPSRLLFPHLTLQQNINLRRVNVSRERGHLPTLLEALFQDARVLDSYPSHCSGGQRQRAVLARAIGEIAAFPVTLLDEPFAQISQDVKPRIYRCLRETVRQSGCVVLMVTHDVAEALIVGDQAVVISAEGLQAFDASSITNNSEYLAASDLRNAVHRALFQRSASQGPNSTVPKASAS